MSDINNAKSNIADKIHQAVSSLLDAEQRLNADLNEARRIARELQGSVEVLTDEKLHLEQQLRTEQEARRALEGVISKIAELVR